MTSTADNEAFVWIWLPEETGPVVAGRLEADNGNVLFNYGKSYLERVRDSKPAITIYEPELPLKRGILPLLDGLTMMALPCSTSTISAAKGGLRQSSGLTGCTSYIM